MLTVVADGLEDSTSAGNTEPPDTAEEPVGLEVLDAQLCDVAARIAVVTSHWLGLITQYVDREGWRASGCRSAAHWLSWRCGLSLPAAYEQLRVARALTGLPRVRAEFDAGRLSYSKVRALTRIAECSDEHGGSEYGDDDLVVLARSATAGQLDRVAAGVRRAHGSPDAAARATRRQLRWWYNDNGMLEGRFRLTPEEGAVVIQALNAAMDTLQHDGTNGDRGPEGQTEDEQTEDGRAADADADSSAEEPVPTIGGGAPCSDAAPSAPSVGAGRRGGLAADALGLLAETFLTGTPAFAHGGDKYRVVVYAHIDTLTDPAPR